MFIIFSFFSVSSEAYASTWGLWLASFSKTTSISVSTFKTLAAVKEGRVYIERWNWRFTNLTAAQYKMRKSIWGNAWMPCYFIVSPISNNYEGHGWHNWRWFSRVINIIKINEARALARQFERHASSMRNVRSVEVKWMSWKNKQDDWMLLQSWKRNRCGFQFYFFTGRIFYFYFLGWRKRCLLHGRLICLFLLKDSWRKYDGYCPDYRIQCDQIRLFDDILLVLGKTYWTSMCQLIIIRDGDKNNIHTHKINKNSSLA